MVMHCLKNHRNVKYYRIAYGYEGSIETGRFTKKKAKAELRKLTKRLQKKRKQRNAWCVPLKFVPKDKAKRKLRERELNIYYDNMRYDAMLEAFEEHGRL
jgi:hypothetical protein